MMARPYHVGEESRYIYHEKQQSALCGQHCLNNLIQGPLFTTMGLATIAQELDARERQLMLEMGTETADAIKYLAVGSALHVYFCIFTDLLGGFT